MIRNFIIKATYVAKQEKTYSMKDAETKQVTDYKGKEFVFKQNVDGVSVKDYRDAQEVIQFINEDKEESQALMKKCLGLKPGQQVELILSQRMNNNRLKTTVEDVIVSAN